MGEPPQKTTIVVIVPQFGASPCSPMTLLTTTMWPLRRRFISGRTALIILTAPKKLVSKTRFISSTLMLSTGPTCPTPALFTAGAPEGAQNPNPGPHFPVHTPPNPVLLTQHVHPAPGDAAQALGHRAVAADIEALDAQRRAQRRPRRLLQLPLLAQVPHGGDDCGEPRCRAEGWRAKPWRPFSPKLLW